ncbi:uncharacterized protein F5891DRAFT_960401 [Suillus fuscotomentosus]|uniref:Uncharacterized protein n=1 Tax=Suillus fuscotomentosus TaxID=1912939 RepID=A0AAD4DWA8_9AGAM|nr:uncharacterized protein F5891DRAFT_960401 [Suillus fuscotomentosus]KAG1895326.1 hypothetical protein F5891DRAFT_960401 [Suillus fuscotomentosus]
MNHNNFQQQLLTEIQKMNTRLAAVESASQIILTNQQTANERAEKHENVLKELLTSVDAMMALGASKSTAGKKNISNKHPDLKPIIQPIFFELCGIDHKVRGERTELLAQIPPLENGEAYEVLNGVKEWRPRWAAKIDDKVNTLYIAEVIDRVWDNETTPEMKDDDYKRSVITTMTKSYWRNLSQQISILVSAEKVEKLTNKQTNSRCRGRHQTVTNHHRGAIPDFEKSYECKGSVALIDTDYGSDYVSYEEGELSADSAERRKDQNQGKGSRKVVGLEWRSLNYIAFLRVLDEIHRHRKSGGDNRGVETNAQEGTAGPSSKRRKVTKPKDLHKTTFDTHPSKMSSRLPKSGKSTVLFNTMVNAVWLEGHKEVKVVEGIEWLKDFRKSIREEDLAAEDKKYLDELEEWNTDEEDEGI